MTSTARRHFPESSVCQQVDVRQHWQVVTWKLLHHLNSHSASLWDWNYRKQRLRRKIYSDSLLLKSLASIKHAPLSFQPFPTHANAYIHSETHTLPTHMHTNPTRAHTGPLWSHKTETTSCSKNTQGTRNSLLNQSNRGASRRARSLSRTLKAHLNATNMFYDKWMRNMHAESTMLHCPRGTGQQVQI